MNESDAPVEQATAAPGEKRNTGTFRLNLRENGRGDNPTLNGVPFDRVRKVTIVAEVGCATQVTVEHAGVPLDVEVDGADVYETTSFNSRHRTYERSADA